MKRKIIGIFVYMLLIGTCFVVTPNMVSADLVDGDYIYTLGGNPLVATITGYTGAGGNITIPSTLGGYQTMHIGSNAFNNVNGHLIRSVIIPDSVITIGNNAFYNCNLMTSAVIGNNVTTIGDLVFFLCRSLTSVTIGNSVTTIGNSAFFDCISLLSVTIPSSVIIIEDQAFIGCSALTSVTIGNNVTTIGAAAFGYCFSLASVTIPSSVTNIGSCAFYCCHALTAINVNGTNIFYASVDGVLYNKAITTLVECPGGKTGVFSIPASVTNLKNLSFFNCTFLTSVIIPSSVTAIEIEVFRLCISLTSITFLGLVAPTYVGTDWIEYTPVELRGHAYTTSNFPPPGEYWNGLMMGAYIPENQPPIASFMYTPTNPLNTTVVHFTDASTDSDGTVVSWWWDFGDHYYSDLQNPIHCYYTDGVYNVTLTVTDNDGASSTYTVYVTVGFAPMLSFNPAYVFFPAIIAGETLSTSFEIWNGGIGTLTYALSPLCNWVTVTPTSGDSTGEHDTITVTIDTTGLSVGGHGCNIDITSNGGSGLFNVTVAIIPPTPILSYTPSYHDFGNITLGQTISTSFEIWNSGTGTLIYSVSDLCNFSVTVTPMEGTSTGEHNTITVSINTTDFALGYHNCALRISSNGGSSMFTIVLHIIGTPVLEYAPTSWYFDEMYPGDSASTSFEIWNNGTGILTYDLGDWSNNTMGITISPTSGESTGEHDTINVSIDTTGWDIGNYTISINMSSNGGFGSFTIYVTVIPPEVLDQQQTLSSYNSMLFSARWGAQSFKPTKNVITRIELYIRKAGSPTDVVLSVRSSLTGADLVSISKPASAISTTSSWVNFDFSDLSVTPGSTYYLVLRTTGGTSTNCYYWGYSMSNPYANGMYHFSFTGGSSWTNYASYDFCFKTYGYS